MSSVRNQEGPLVGGCFCVVISIRAIASVERLSSSGRVRYGRFHCILLQVIEKLISTAPINDFGIFENDNFLINSARFILANEEAPTTTSTPPEPAQGTVDIGLVLGLVIVSSVLLTALIGIVVVMVYIRYSSTKRR